MGRSTLVEAWLKLMLNVDHGLHYFLHHCPYMRIILVNENMYTVTLKMLKFYSFALYMHFLHPESILYQAYLVVYG